MCPLLGQDTEGEPPSTNRMISFVFFFSPIFLVRILQHTLTQHARQKETQSIALFFILFSIIITVELVVDRFRIPKETIDKHFLI